MWACGGGSRLRRRGRVEGGRVVDWLLRAQGFSGVWDMRWRLEEAWAGCPLEIPYILATR